MEHVRVGHDDLPGLADRRADRRRRVAVVGRRRDRQAGAADELRRTPRPGPGRAPWSGTGTAPGPTDPRRSPGGRAACSTATCPTPSGVTTTTSSPAWTASIASAWWMYGRSIPRAASPARIRGSSQAGHVRRTGLAGRRITRGGRRRGRATAPRAAAPGRLGGGAGRRCACGSDLDMERMMRFARSLAARLDRACDSSRVTTPERVDTSTPGTLSRRAKLTRESSARCPRPRCLDPRHARRPPNPTRSRGAADEPEAAAPRAGAAAAIGSLSDLPVAGLTRRRVGCSRRRSSPPGSSCCSPARSARPGGLEPRRPDRRRQRGAGRRGRRSSTS